MRATRSTCSPRWAASRSPASSASRWPPPRIASRSCSTGSSPAPRRSWRCGSSPRCARCLLASHRSAEPGHRHVLEALELVPYLDLGLRLGEGTGAALCIGLARSAVAILTEMATFASAGVSGAGAPPREGAGEAVRRRASRSWASRRCSDNRGCAAPRALPALCGVRAHHARSDRPLAHAAGAAAPDRLARPQRDRDPLRDRRAGRPRRRHRLLRLPARGPEEAERGRDGRAEPRDDRGPQAGPGGRDQRGQSARRCSPSSTASRSPSTSSIQPVSTTSST